VRKEGYETSIKDYEGRDSSCARLCGTVKFGTCSVGSESGVGPLTLTPLGLVA